MSSNFSNNDEYGFVRPEKFDFKEYEKFMSEYLGVLSRRRQKWDSLVSGGYTRLSRGPKLKRFVRKGVPSIHRKAVWMEVSGANKMRREEPDLYKTMVAMEIKNKVVDDQIKTDLPRTFPNNTNFDPTSPKSYQTPLYNILKAFANNNVTIGYCQGINYVAGLLYLVTKDEDSSFWLLKVICEKLLPEYYTESMPGLLTDMKVLAQLARQEIPAVANHIDKMQMPWALFSSKWFICLYSEVLPVETVLRIWDALFYEGTKILFRVALGLLKLNQDRLLAQTEFSALAEELNRITDSHMTIHCHTFLEEVCSKTGCLPRARITKLKEEFGAQVRTEQAEREKRRREDGSGMRDG